MKQMTLLKTFGKMRRLKRAKTEEHMPRETLRLGDFSAVYTPDPTEGKTLAQLATRWNSGVRVRMVNPFEVGTPQIARRADQHPEDHG